MGTKVTKQILANRLNQKGIWTAQQVDAYVEAFFNVLHEGITNDSSVKVKGLGTFKTIDVADRASVDVNTGERIVIPGHRKLKFVEEDRVNVLLNESISVQEEVQVISEPAQEPEDVVLTVVAEPAQEPDAVVSELVQKPEAVVSAVVSEPASESVAEPQQSVDAKKTNWWIWALVALLVSLLAVSIVMAVCCNHDESSTPAQTEQKADVDSSTSVQINQPQYKIHAFQKGESLTTISILYYNNPDSVERIMQLNGLSDTSFIPLGTELKLP